MTNLQEGHEYNFRIYAQNAAGLSEKPAEIKPAVQAKLPFGQLFLLDNSHCSLLPLLHTCFACITEKPSAPKDIKVTSTNKGSISVAWQPPEDDGGSPITGYILETCRSTSSTWMEAGKVDGFRTSHEITGLVDNAQYYVRVFAENQAGISKKYSDLDEPVFARKPIGRIISTLPHLHLTLLPSKFQCPFYPPDPPGAPQNLAVPQVDRDQVTLTWEAPETDGGSEITDYIIEAKGPKDSDFYILAKVDSSRLKYTATGLRPGQKYEFRVKAKNSAGVSQFHAELSEAVTTKAPISE